MLSSPTPEYHAYNDYRSTICTGKLNLYEAAERLEWIGTPSSTLRALYAASNPSRIRRSTLVDRYRSYLSLAWRLKQFRFSLSGGEAARNYGLEPFKSPERSALGTEKDSSEQGTGVNQM